MIGLHEPSFCDEDKSLVLDCLETSWVSTSGKYIDRFSKLFSEYTGIPYVVPVNSGTSALFLMTECLKRQIGIEGAFEVLMPDLTFIATANAVFQAGGVPVLIDVAPGSLLVDIDYLIDEFENHFRYHQKTRLWYGKKSGLPLLAFMPVHIMGYAVESQKLDKFSDAFGVPILEDAAEALGSWNGNEHVGRHGFASAFSFNGNKLLTTGTGGIVGTNDSDFFHLVRHISSTAKIDSLRYVHDAVGYNLGMSNISAALGFSQLGRIDQILKEKVRVREAYQTNLGQHHTLLVKESFPNQPNHWLVNMFFSSSSERDSKMGELGRKGYQSRPLWMPIHLQPAYEKKSRQLIETPNGIDVWNRCLSLPSSPTLTGDQIKDICSVITG